MKKYFFLIFLATLVTLTGCAGTASYHKGKTYEELVTAMRRSPTRTFTNKSGNKVAAFFSCSGWEISGTYGGGYYTAPYAEARMVEDRFELKSNAIIQAKRLFATSRGQPHTNVCGTYSRIDDVDE